MHILDWLFGLAAPHECVGCGREGSLLCPWCQELLDTEFPSRCYRCHALTVDSATCRACRRQSRLKHVWITASYDGVAKQLTHKLKFERARSAASIVADAMADSLPFLPGYIACPLPTASVRRRQRGYDQAELIARHLARQKQLSFAPLLLRVGQTRQVGATREQRQKQAKDTFRVRRPALVAGQRILLIDDITTTGASLEEAARTLKIAGAKSVDAAVFAQKQ